MNIVPKIVERRPDEDVFAWAECQGYGSLLSRLIASRFGSAEEAEKGLSNEISQITDPALLPDVDVACERIIEAITGREEIVCAVDYDNDGVSSGAILYRALVEIFEVEKEKVHLYSGVRFTEGYGLSYGLAKRISADFSGRKVLVITADMGSSDQERIDFLADEGIDVIVTDHHEIPERGIPTSACAVVNPTRKDSEFGDPLIAGCGVAWFLIARLTTLCENAGVAGFIQRNKAANRSKRNDVIGLTSFACSGTIGDCVSLSRSHNNRIICNIGMRFIQSESYPCWTAFKSLLDPNETVNSTHISFTLAPMSNACGRLVKADAALDFLITNSEEKAFSLLDELGKENNERKRIESVMRETAVQKAREQFESGATCAVILLEDGHPGVQGICASRVVETFGKPVCIFSPKGDGTTTITASLRSVEGINIKHALDSAFAKLPIGTPPTYGGHYFAGGCSIDKSILDLFGEGLDASCKEMKDKAGIELRPVLEHDGDIGLRDISCESISEIYSLGPFGREFPIPCFRASGYVTEVQVMGAESNHLRLNISHNGFTNGIKCVLFYFDRIEDFAIPEKGTGVEIIGEVQSNWFRNECSPQIIIRHLEVTNG